MESCVYMTSGIVDSYEQADISIESSLTKIYCTQAFNDSIRDLYDIYTINAPHTELDQLTALSHLLNSFLNTSDTIRQQVAIECASFIGVNKVEHIRKLRDFLNHPGYLYKEYRRLRKLRQNLVNSKNSVFYLWEQVHPSLADNADILESSSVKLIDAMQSAFLTHGAHIVEYPLNLKRLANIATSVYVMNACLARCSRSYSIGLKNCEYERFLINVLFYFMRKDVEFNYDEVRLTRASKNCDQLIINSADQMAKEKDYPLTDCLMRSY